MLSSKSAQFLGYMDLGTPTTYNWHVASYSFGGNGMCMWQITNLGATAYITMHIVK